MLRNMLKICLAFRKSEPKYAYKRYAYKKHVILNFDYTRKIPLPNTDLSWSRVKIQVRK